MQKRDELSLTHAQKPWWPHTALRRGLLQDTGPGRPPTKAVCREGVGSSQNRREGDAEADDRPAEDTPRASSSCRTRGRDPGAGEKPSGCGAAQTRPRRARVQPGGRLCRRTGTWEGGGAGGATRDVGRHRPTRPGRPAAAQPRRTRCPRLFCVDRSSSFSSRDFASRLGGEGPRCTARSGSGRSPVRERGCRSHTAASPGPLPAEHGPLTPRVRGPREACRSRPESRSVCSVPCAQRARQQSFRDDNSGGRRVSPRGRRAGAPSGGPGAAPVGPPGSARASAPPLSSVGPRALQIA